jgi:S1-C subfamily serine protease
MCVVSIALCATLPLSRADAASSTARTGIVDIVANLGYLKVKTAASGIVLNASGTILTNNHVIEGATDIVVTGDGDNRYSASVLGYDMTDDIALIQMQGASHVPVASVSQTASLKVGATVTAVGNAGGSGGQPRLASGTILALDQSVRAISDTSGAEILNGLIETSANVALGDSGGALLNRAGQVIGLTTAGLSFSDSAVTGEGFAIPISRALAIAQVIERHEESSVVHVGPTAFLGAVVQAQLYSGVGPYPTPGALVQAVVQSSPAARLGLVPGDLITSFGGRPISSPSSLQSLLLAETPREFVHAAWLSPSGRVDFGTVDLAAGPPL